MNFERASSPLTLSSAGAEEREKTNFFSFRPKACLPRPMTTCPAVASSRRRKELGEGTGRGVAHLVHAKLPCSEHIHWDHEPGRTGKSAQPADWKVCATAFGLVPWSARVGALALTLLFMALAPSPALAAMLVMVAGTPSHGPGDHKFNAGSILLKKCLASVPQLEVVLYTNGWPRQPDAFEGAVAIF